jgi:hypothetical protein
MFIVGPTFFSSPEGGCSSFLYYFPVLFGDNSVLYDYLPEWSIYDTTVYFRVYENPVSNLNLGTATVVSVLIEGFEFMQDIIDQIELQLPDFTCFFINGISAGDTRLVISRANGEFAVEDGEFDGDTYGMFAMFVDQIGGSPYPESPYNTILEQAACFTPLPP